MSLPLYLQPKANYDLIRLGKNNDGGYLVERKSIEISKYLISVGIYNDWSFEKDFIKTNKGSKIFCYDSQVSLNFFAKKIVKHFFFVFYYGFAELYNLIKLYFDFNYFFSKNLFFKKHISYNDIINIVKKNNLDNQIFLKIDIEGSEYRVLEDLISIKEKISGICIEFHDVDLHLDKIKKFIKEIDLTLVHIHPNNYAKKDLNNDPTVIELTFAKKAKSNNNKLVLPNLLDQKNNPQAEDILIKFS
jgi:hypothetical protein